MPDIDPTLDVIEIIGAGITSMNRCLANALPTEKGYDELENQRDKALDRLHLLVKIFTENSTHRFTSADSDLALINGELQAILHKLGKLGEMIDAATEFVSAIDTVIASISKIV